MLFLLFICLIYFLPAIIARDKSDAGLIFLVNLFLGWTVIGWIVTFIWACTADTRPVQYVWFRRPVQGASVASAVH